ncbi:MAG: type I-MYXAN CRISPR-associated protein Cas6/Cmx6 [Gammaproteobacteria bacterium]
MDVNLFWDEDEAKTERYVVPDDIVDVAFAVNCRCLPLDHAQPLSDALHAALPWLGDEELAGVHLIHGAESGNGWYRPEDPASELLYLSRRTRMMLRLPKERVADAEGLVGRDLDIGGYPLTVGRSSVRKLSDLPTLFARYVIVEDGEDEMAFLSRTAQELKALGITVRKVLCGKEHTLALGEAGVQTRSVMVAELEPERAVVLQQRGLGRGRKAGCGLFLPHKGIAPIQALDDSD